MHRRPSKITIVATGSTVVTAAVASGVVALWPGSTPGVPTADSLTAGSVQQAGAGLRLTRSDALPSQVLISRTQSARRRQQSLALAGRIAAARRAAARARAERLAAAAAAQHQAQPTAAPSPSSSPAPSASPSPPAPAAPPAPSGSPQQIALGMLSSYGWSSDQFSCLVSLWNQESGWNVEAANPTSGAYGIPQALPGSKMASAGPDWQTDATTQIRWGLGYIKGTYGSPCGAWAHEQAVGWY
jgi:hypothetical protein